MVLGKIFPERPYINLGKIWAAACQNFSRVPPSSIIHADWDFCEKFYILLQLLLLLHFSQMLLFGCYTPARCYKHLHTVTYVNVCNTACAVLLAVLLACSELLVLVLAARISSQLGHTLLCCRRRQLDVAHFPLQLVGAKPETKNNVNLHFAASLHCAIAVLLL